MSVPQLSEVCLVANLQTMGPTFLAAAEGVIFDHGAGMLLAARIVITSGMGNSKSGLNQLNGPIPISEIDLDEDYVCYFYPVEMQQQPKPENEFSTGKGTYIICLIIEEQVKSEFRDYEELMGRVVKPYVNKFDFSHSISGEVPENLQQAFSKILTDINSEINNILEFAQQFKGGSLFDVGLLATLPEKLSVTAKKLMLNPKGISEADISNKAALKILYQTGLVEREERDGEAWIIPK